MIPVFSPPVLMKKIDQSDGNFSNFQFWNSYDFDDSLFETEPNFSCPIAAIAFDDADDLCSNASSAFQENCPSEDPKPAVREFLNCSVLPNSACRYCEERKNIWSELKEIMAWIYFWLIYYLLDYWNDSTLDLHDTEIFCAGSQSTSTPSTTSSSRPTFDFEFNEGHFAERKNCENCRTFGGDCPHSVPLKD